MNDMDMREHPQRGGWFASKKVTWVLIGFLAVGAFFLITGHTAHVLGVLPYLIFLLCPLMMLFMHGGHSDHDGHGGSDQQEQPPEGGGQ